MSTDELTIIVNDFVLRQTEKSSLSHMAHTWSELIWRIKTNWDKRESGGREGIVLVPVDPQGFFSPVVELAESDVLLWKFSARSKGEHSRKPVKIVNRRQSPAKSVKIVLYRSDVLTETETAQGKPDNKNSWEIISVNASPYDDEPIRPETLMHNHFGSPGGTKTGMTSEEFEAALQKSFEFWKDKASV